MRRCDGIGRCGSFRSCHDKRFILIEMGFPFSIQTRKGSRVFQPSEKSEIYIRGCVGTGRRAGFGLLYDRGFILIETDLPFGYKTRKGFSGNFSRVKNLEF